MPQHFVTSATEMTGKEELLSFIDNINQEMFKNNLL
jgi:GTP-binding protein